jgi:hypothetical protein
LDLQQEADIANTVSLLMIDHEANLESNKKLEQLQGLHHPF